MKVSTDDDRFGFVVTSLRGRGMFRFQMIVGGRLIGDAEPCILGSAMHQLGHLGRLDDERLGRLSEDPVAVLSALRSDEVLHDAATLSLAESLDRWLIHGYMHEGDVTILAQEYKNGELEGPLLFSIINGPEYDLILDGVRRYWQKAANDDSTLIGDPA